MVDVAESARRDNPGQVNRLHMRGEIDHGVLGGCGGAAAVIIHHHLSQRGRSDSRQSSNYERTDSAALGLL